MGGGLSCYQTSYNALDSSPHPCPQQTVNLPQNMKINDENLSCKAEKVARQLCQRLMNQDNRSTVVINQEDNSWELIS